MRRVFRHFMVGVVGAVIGLVVGAGVFVPSLPAKALADTCLNDYQLGCYARGTFDDGSAWGGGYVQVEVVALSASENAYLNEELWTTTNDGTNYWAEIGYSYNQPYCRGTGLRWFLYYQNPSASHGECFGSSPSTGTWHQLEIQEDTSSKWYIYLDDNEEAIDSGTSGWNDQDYAGLEYHDAGYTSISGDAYFSYNEVRSTSCCSWYYWDQGATEAEYPDTYSWIWTATDPWIHGYDYGI